MSAPYAGTYTSQFLNVFVICLIKRQIPKTHNSSTQRFAWLKLMWHHVQLLAGVKTDPQRQLLCKPGAAFLDDRPGWIEIWIITPLLTAFLHAMIFHLLFPCLLALALVDEMDEVEEEEVVRLDGGGLCNLTTVGRRWFDVRDVKSKKGWQTEKYDWGALRIGLSYSLHISLSEMPLAIYAGRSGGKPQSEMVAGFFHSWWAKMSRRGREEVYQVHPGGVPPLVVVLKGDLEARWVEEMVQSDSWCWFGQARDWEEES